MVARSKRYKNVKDLIEITKAYSIKEAVSIIKKSKKLKFDETLDIAINLGVDPKHADQIVKGVVKLPHGTGKVLKIAVFAKDEKSSEAKDAGADYIILGRTVTEAENPNDVLVKIKGSLWAFM